MNNPAFEYREHCKDFVQSAANRPTMYFVNLIDLQHMLSGHWIAYEQLRKISREESFNESFKQWLWTVKGLSTSSGWADAVEQFAGTSGRKPELAFRELVEEFLSKWAT